LTFPNGKKRGEERNTLFQIDMFLFFGGYARNACININVYAGLLVFEKEGEDSD
jgi:hypothetical protein